MGISEREQRREIDGVTYIMNPLPFGIGHKALLRLTKLAGPVLASAVGKNGASMAIAAATAALTEDDVDYFADKFGNASWYIDGAKQVPLLKLNQEAHFAYRYTAFFEWLAFGIEANFAPFLSDLTKRLGVTVSATKTPPSTSAEATG